MKTKNIIGLTAIVVVVLFALYIFFQFKGIDLKKYIITGGIIAAIVIIAIYIIKWYNERNATEQEIEVPKKLVDPDVAIKIWKEQFLKHNNIPYVQKIWENNELEAIKQDALEIKDAIVSPDHKTGDTFLFMEVIVREGTRTGMLLTVMQIDQGEEHIRKHWFQRLNWHTALNQYEVSETKYPLSTNKSYHERLMMRKVELQQEGYSDEEIDEVIQPFLEAQKTKDEVQTKKKPIKSPEVKEAFPEYEEEDSVDITDVEQDAEEYRRRNQ